MTSDVPPDAGHQSKASWFPDMEHEFLQRLASHQMEYGTAANTPEFKAWAVDFKVKWEKFPLLTPKQMRGKRERFKKQFDSWNALTRLTGFGWDPVTGRPKITDEQWDNFKAVSQF